MRITLLCTTNNRTGITNLDLGHKSHSLSIRLQILVDDNVISKPLSEALLEIVKLGNAAAHGQVIDSEEAELILMKSDSLLNKLEDSLKNI